MGNNKSLYSKPDLLTYYIDKKDQNNILKLLEADPDLVEAPIGKNKQETPLMKACFNGNGEIVELLLRHKADPNHVGIKGETPLTYAVKRDHFEVVEKLLEFGANPTHVSQIGLRVIEYAILGGFYSTAQLIFNRLSRKEKEDIQDP